MQAHSFDSFPLFTSRSEPILSAQNAKGSWNLLRYFLFIIMILCSSLITHIGYATPLADYSPGKITTDMTWYPSLKITNSYSTPNSTTSKTSTADGKSGNFDFSLTAGLSGKWALQYRQFNPETITYVNSTLLQNFGMKTQELNVLYKIDKSIAAFAGSHQVCPASPAAL